MCKYEMDPMSIVEDTERTDGQGDTSISGGGGGIMIIKHHFIHL